jgi:hypothetical protein
VAAMKDDLEVIENADYNKLISVYQGKLTAAKLLDDANLLQETDRPAASLSNATVGYGLADWFLYNGQPEQAIGLFRQVIAGNQWASFGYIAAEAELKRVNFRNKVS